MELAWKNIDIDVLNHNKGHGQKRIKLVSNACGHVEQRLLAIMGPSGSGKTTLIQALAGRIPRESYTTGSITLNDRERNIEAWKDLVGFVNQDDAIYEELTARETVAYAAKFRLRDKHADIDKRINDLFKKLAISHVLNCQMTNLSGDERKRVMIANELIKNPKIIFLDEPTSGLDNNTAVKIVRLLKEFSKEGKIVVFTIHQPGDTITEEFDDVLLLSQGRSIYMGKMADCEKHLISSGFEKEAMESMYNFAMKILSVDPGVYHETAESSKLDVLINEVKERYNFSEKEKHPKAINERHVNLVPNLNHTMQLLKRRFKLEFFLKKNIWMHFWCLILLGIVVYVLKSARHHIFRNKNKNKIVLDDYNALFPGMRYDALMIIVRNISGAFAALLIAFIPITASTAFNNDLGHVKREVAGNRYSLTSYFLSVFIFELVKGLPALIVIMGSFRAVVGSCIDILFVFTFIPDNCDVLSFVRLFIS